MIKIPRSGYNIFLAFLLLVTSVFLWASITGTRLIGDGKDTYTPDGNTATRSRTSTGVYHRFYHK